MKIYTLRNKVCLVIVLFGLLSTLSLKAQSVDVDFGADLVSSYVWRGYKQAGASIQPTLSASISGFSLGAWASTDFTSKEGKKEVDFTAAYENSGFKVAATDYWWDGEGQYRYFSSPGETITGTIWKRHWDIHFPNHFP